jgi:hypothetical protein
MDSILTDDQLDIFHKQLVLCRDLDGMTAEIGVYKGDTSKIIKRVLNKTHYCYDTFEGIYGSSAINGDTHSNGEFYCNLEDVKSNINMDNIIYKKGFFPETFHEQCEMFSFVYSDTATYFGTKTTLEKFRNNMVRNGKIIFYVDSKNKGVKNAIDEFINNDSFIISKISNFIIFTFK